MLKFLGIIVTFAVILFCVFDECCFISYWLCTRLSNEPPQRILGGGDGDEPEE